MDSVCLTSEQDSFYYWTAVLSDLNNPAQTSEIFQEISSKFQEKFFKIPRGNTESLKKVCDEVNDALISLIPNWNKTEFKLEEYSNSLFTNFHSQVMDLQASKALALFEDMQSTYKFEFYYERILLSNQRLDDKKNEYLAGAFELKEFRAEALKKLFLDKLKNFMESFNANTPNEVDYKCCAIEEQFMNEVDLMVALNKRKLNEFLIENTVRYNYGILTLGTVRVHPADNEGESMIRHRCYLIQEKIALMQVVSISTDSCVCLFRLCDSNKNLFLLISPQLSTRLEVQDQDSEIIIASGSNYEHFIYFNNNKRTMSKGYIVKPGKYVETKCFELDQGPVYVLSAAFLSVTNEIIFLNNSRVLSYKSFTSKSRSISSIETYSYSRIDGNGEFLFLISYDEFAVVNSSLQIVYKESRHVTHCFIDKKKLSLAVFEAQGDFCLDQHEIEDEFFAPSNTVKQLLFKARHQLRSNYHTSLGKFTELIKSNQFKVEDRIDRNQERKEE